MVKLRFKQVDVFTTVPFYGNPVAVLFDVNVLADAEMQRIAAWTNLSETVFVQTSGTANYRLRIFTPDRELPFAGHPTIGAAHAVREAGIVTRECAEFTQECRAGIIPITVGRDGVIMARVPRPAIADSTLDYKQMNAVLGDDSCTDGVIVDVGPRWIVTRVDTSERLYGIQVAAERLIELSRTNECVGLCAYAFDERRNVHVRSFAPAVGVFEDPVCGSGNAAVAAHIRMSDTQHLIGIDYTAHQGRALGRDGRVHVRIDGDHVLIGGHVVTVIEGHVTLHSTTGVDRISAYR